MSDSAAWEGTFHGEPAIWLKSGKYAAIMLPNIGGNLVAFRDTKRDFRFLREPSEEEMPAFKARPLNHGVPVLFPPNRYENGRFPWEGSTLQLPINEQSRNNHLHGFLYNTPWTVDDYGCTANESYVVVSVRVDETHPAYSHFPYTFTFTLRYVLSVHGLLQHVIIRNDGHRAMPCLLAFHTTINAPFTSEGASTDCCVKLTIGRRWELNDRMLPTGRLQSLSREEEHMRDDGVYPFNEVMDNHYTAEAQDGRNRMELTDAKQGIKLIYDVGTSYKQWMVWNNFAKEGFFCPEPQINLVNAPNVKLPDHDIGLYGLAPGQIWEETSRLYVAQAPLFT
jgi:aldose 1-epimerase